MDRVCKFCGNFFIKVAGKSFYCIDCTYFIKNNGRSKVLKRKAEKDFLPTLVMIGLAKVNQTLCDVDTVFINAGFTGYDPKLAAQIKQKYWLVRASARRRNRAFEIAFEDYLNLTNKPCYYCKATKYQFSVDRKNNLIGYLKDNVVACCCRCNVSKNTSSAKYFQSLIK